jgi:type II secretory pathway predicted ATPase ExeA
MHSKTIATDNLVSLDHRVLTCPRNRRRIIAAYGDSGTGKTQAMEYLVGNYKTLSYTALPGLSVAALSAKLTRVLGMPVGRYGLAFDTIITEIPKRGYKIFCVDEADKLGAKNLELIRYISDALKDSLITVLFGEEELYYQIRREARLANRCTHVEFKRMNKEDAICVAAELLQVPFSEDLVIAIWEDSKGVISEFSIALEMAEHECLLQDWKSCNLEQWGRRPFRSDLLNAPSFAQKIAA